MYLKHTNFGFNPNAFLIQLIDYFNSLEILKLAEKISKEDY